MECFICVYIAREFWSFFWYIAIIMDTYYYFQKNICVYLDPYVSRYVWRSEENLELFLSFHQMGLAVELM